MAAVPRAARVCGPHHVSSSTTAVQHATTTKNLDLAIPKSPSVVDDHDDIDVARAAEPSLSSPSRLQCHPHSPPQVSHTLPSPIAPSITSSNPNPNPTTTTVPSQTIIETTSAQSPATRIAFPHIPTSVTPSHTQTNSEIQLQPPHPHLLAQHLNHNLNNQHQNHQLLIKDSSIPSMAADLDHDPVHVDITALDAETSSSTATTTTPTPVTAAVITANATRLYARALVSTREAGSVIGRAGRTIHQIREASGARIIISGNVPNTHDRVMTVVGPLDSVANAFGRITDALAAESIRDGNSNVDQNNRSRISQSSRFISDDTDSVNNVIIDGTTTTNTRSTTTTTTTSSICTLDEVSANSDNDNNNNNNDDDDGHSDVEVSETDADVRSNKSTACATLRLLVTDQLMGYIIGRSGTTIKMIQDKSQAKIVAHSELLGRSTERVVELIGTSAQILIAVKESLNILATKLVVDKTQTRYFNPTAGANYVSMLDSGAAQLAATNGNGVMSRDDGNGRTMENGRLVDFHSDGVYLGAEPHNNRGPGGPYRRRGYGENRGNQHDLNHHIHRQHHPYQAYTNDEQHNNQHQHHQAVIHQRPPPQQYCPNFDHGYPEHFYDPDNYSLSTGYRDDGHAQELNAVTKGGVYHDGSYEYGGVTNNGDNRHTRQRQQASTDRNGSNLQHTNRRTSRYGRPSSVVSPYERQQGTRHAQYRSTSHHKNSSEDNCRNFGEPQQYGQVVGTGHSIDPNMVDIPMHQAVSQHLYVPNDLMGVIIGKNGNKINKIRTASGCQIVIDQGDCNSNSSRLISVMGPYESATYAVNLLYDSINRERSKSQSMSAGHCDA